MCGTRRHVFLLNLLAQQDSKRRHVFLCEKQACVLVRQEDMSSSHKKTCLFFWEEDKVCLPVEPEDTSSCGTEPLGKNLQISCISQIAGDSLLIASSLPLFCRHLPLIRRKFAALRRYIHGKIRRYLLLIAVHFR